MGVLNSIQETINAAQNPMLDVMADVVNERSRQNEKWGVQDHNPIEWMAILSEEVGEAAKEAVDYHFGAGGFSDLDKKELLLKYRTEMVQVAAVAIQAIECLDRNLKKG